MRLINKSIYGLTFSTTAVFALTLGLYDTSQAAQKLDRITTSSVVRPTLASANVSTLKSGLDALTRDDYETARNVRRKLPQTSLERRLLNWALAYFAGKHLSSVEIAEAAQRRNSWPGSKRLRAHSERALARENTANKTVLATFGDSRPETIEGAVILARALKANGQTKKAVSILSPFWIQEKLDAKEEISILSEFGKLLPKSVHRARMEAMLYEDRVRSAERVAPYAGASSLAAAWGAVARKQKQAGSLLEKVPQSQRSAGYIYARARYNRRLDRFSKAAGILKQAPRDSAALIDPDQWWKERRVLTRELLDIKKYSLAYQTASGHHGGSSATQADAAFHAGWIALRFLGDAKTASRHFELIAQLTTSPISQARAYYWLGRAAEKMDRATANAHFARAAKYATTYYGQLAAARIGKAKLTITYPKASEQDRTNFSKRSEVRAIQLLHSTNHNHRAFVFYKHLAETLESPGELALLAVMAERHGYHHYALKVGKIAARRGVNVGALTHPLGAIPQSANTGRLPVALAYAISRQESEFNRSAVSPAGARGLLQLMPGTAKGVARRSGLAYSPARLTSDPAYNATLGSRYLSEQISKFGGSYILAFAAYNAGPGKANEWIERFGDPRGKSIDQIVDWVERIPYYETRNYVQRVMENTQVYRWRINSRFDIASDIQRGKR